MKIDLVRLHRSFLASIVILLLVGHAKLRKHFCPRGHTICEQRIFDI